MLQKLKFRNNLTGVGRLSLAVSARLTMRLVTSGPKDPDATYRQPTICIFVWWKHSKQHFQFTFTWLIIIVKNNNIKIFKNSISNASYCCIVCSVLAFHPAVVGSNPLRQGFITHHKFYLFIHKENQVLQTRL